jgi:hypothetical protein
MLPPLSVKTALPEYDVELVLFGRSIVMERPEGQYWLVMVPGELPPVAVTCTVTLMLPGGTATLKDRAILGNAPADKRTTKAA